MARKKKQDEVQELVYAPFIPQPITETIEKNYNAHSVRHIVFLNRFGDRLINDGGVDDFFCFLFLFCH